MWMLNRNSRYKIIKELIKNASVEQIKEIIINSGFTGYQKDDDLEYRRKELLSYLDEMNECWNNHYTDMIDRQYIRMEKETKKNEELNKKMPSNVCVIFKDEEEEELFSNLAFDINYRKNNSKEKTKVLKKKLK